MITQTVSLTLDSVVKSKELVTAEWFINTHIITHIQRCI